MYIPPESSREATMNAKNFHRMHASGGGVSTRQSET